MKGRALSAIVFGLGILAVLLWWRPHRDVLEFDTVEQATAELGAVLPPLPAGAHSIRVFGHEDPKGLHLRCSSDESAIEAWLGDAEPLADEELADVLPFVPAQIDWWHPGLRRAGAQRLEVQERVPGTYRVHGVLAGVDRGTIYIWRERAG